MLKIKVGIRDGDYRVVPTILPEFRQGRVYWFNPKLLHESLLVAGRYCGAGKSVV